jgi:hypothetical protein
MDDLCERNGFARRAMIEAFTRACTLARNAGAAEDDLIEVDQYFFVANAEVRRTFGVVVLLARIRGEPGEPL